MHFSKTIIAIFMLLCLIAPATKLSAQLSAQTTPTNDWHYNAIGYYQYLPTDYNCNTNNYPVVIFFHGAGEKGNGTTELPRLLSNGIPKLIANGAQFPFIMIAPQLKSAMADWYPWYMDEVVEYAKRTLRIDQSRIYVTGLSLGGGATWSYSETFPGKVAAVAPLCGHYNSPAAACTVYTQYGLPIWAFHGSADNTIPLYKTQEMINAINACTNPTINPTPKFTIYPGVGHNCWDLAYDNTHNVQSPINIYEWLLQQQSNKILANAGDDMYLPQSQTSISLTGVASTTYGSINSYAWTQVDAPAGSFSNITDASTPTVTIAGLIPGKYTFKFEVTNTTGLKQSDYVNVTVGSAICANSVNLILPSTNAVTIQNVIAGDNFVNNNCANLIAKIHSTASSNDIVGNTTSKVWVECNPSSTIGNNYVKRHYEITPAINASSATGRVTLYFKQSEFDEFNLINTIDLPTNSNDATGKANLLIAKHAGVSNNGTGFPMTYTGATVNINPNDADIIWNSTASRWEVSFDVTGFSGFFVTTIASPLPIKLTQFTASKQNNYNDVKWQVASNANIHSFEIESSSNGIDFTSMGKIGTSNTTNYHYADYSNQYPVVFYRLKTVNNNMSVIYSSIIKVSNYKNAIPAIYPNLVTNNFIIDLNDNNYNTITIIDVLGNTRYQKDINGIQNQLQIDASSFTSGHYIIILKGQQGSQTLRFIKD